MRAKVLESGNSRERIGQGPIGTFTPWRELAGEWKGCDSGLLYGWPMCLY